MSDIDKAVFSALSLFFFSLYFFGVSFSLSFFLFLAFSCLFACFCPVLDRDNGYKLSFQNCRVYARGVWRNFLPLELQNIRVVHFLGRKCISQFPFVF